MTNPPQAQVIGLQGFSVRDGELMIGGHSARGLADTFGTPLYVYDADGFRRQLAALSDAVGPDVDIYYSVKANPNPDVARIFVEAGAGLEIASGAEYVRARAAGADPARILFAGPGKSEQELAHVVDNGIGEIHLESNEEIAALTAIAAQHRRRVPVALRINPVAAAGGGAMRMGGKPAQFGFDEEELDALVDRLRDHQWLDLTGIHLFAGTQGLDAGVLLAQWRHAIDVARRTADRLGRPLHTVDLGGGLGIPYFAGDQPIDLAAIKAEARALFAEAKSQPGLKTAKFILEPGRFLAGPAGVYLSRVRSVKPSRGTTFVVLDGGMHHHLAASGNLGQVIKKDYPIVAVSRLGEPPAPEAQVVVGPLCTPLDTVGRKVAMPAVEAGDVIAILQSGAYGLTSSPVGFLSQPMPAEVLVDGANHPRLIRPAGSFAQPITALP